MERGWVKLPILLESAAPAQELFFCGVFYLFLTEEYTLKQPI